MSAGGNDATGAVSEQTLRDEMKAAMRARDAMRLKVVRSLLAAIKNKVIADGGKELGDRDVVAVIKREAKQCRETLDYARKADRGEAVAEHEAELAILESYLPAQLGDDELRAVIEAIVSETGATAIGPVMKELSSRHGGNFDGKAASRIVGEVLAR